MIQKKGLKSISDKYYNNGIVYREQSDTSLIYSHYHNGWYPISGYEVDHPCRGYSGIMISLHDPNSTSYVYIKLLFLINAYAYILTQDREGNILCGGFRRISIP